MNERDRFQREMRAMAVTNRRLHAQLADAPSTAPKPTATKAVAQAASEHLPHRLAQRARAGRTVAKRAVAAVERKGVGGAGKDAARKVKRRVTGTR